jgi:hypothetical protein
MKSLLLVLLFGTAVATPALAEDYQNLAAQGMAAVKAGEYAKAADLYGAAFKLHAGEQWDYYNAASAAAHAGNTSLALEWLDHVFPAGEDWTIPVNAIAVGKDFAAVRAAEAWPAFRRSLDKRLADFQAQTGPLKAELLAIYNEDQSYRLRLPGVEKQYGRDSQQMRDLRQTISAADSANQAKVSAILDNSGWLGPKQVGWKASDAIFLVIQHADLAYQKKYLTLVRAAVKDGKARADELALLEDRMGLREGRRQVYGSQIYTDPKTGLYVVGPLEDPDHVDARRAAVGLQPLGDYVKQWNIKWDVEQYKRDLPALEERLALPKS